MMYWPQQSELDDFDHLRQLVDADIPFDDAEGWSDFAGRNYDIVPSDEDFEKDFQTIASGYVENSLNTPLCEFRSLLHRLQDNISENHRQRIMDGKESFIKINEALLEQASNECVSLNHFDLNELLKKQEAYSVPYVINVDDVCDTFERGESFGTLQEKKQRQKAEENKDSLSNRDRRENQFRFDISDHHDEVPRVYKRTAPNPPQLSASMLAAAAKRIHHEVDSGDSNDAYDSQPNFVISSVKSLAPQDFSTTLTDGSPPGSATKKGLVPILPKPSLEFTVRTSTPATAPPVSQTLSSVLRPTRAGGSSGVNSPTQQQGQQHPLIYAYIDEGGEIKLVNSVGAVSRPVSTAAPQRPYRFLIQSSSGTSKFVNYNGGAKGIPQFQTRVGRPLILSSTSAGSLMQPTGIRNLTSFVTANSRPQRPPLNSKLLPVRLNSPAYPSTNLILTKPAQEVPLQAAPFRVTVTNENKDELSETSKKFFEALTPGSSPAFGSVSASSLPQQEENADKILGF